jgi:hypothetical protein
LRSSPSQAAPHRHHNISIAFFNYRYRLRFTLEAAMIQLDKPCDPAIHAAACQAARRCRFIVQACLREEEWQDADREFYQVIRESLEAFAARQTALSNAL